MKLFKKLLPFFFTLLILLAGASGVYVANGLAALNKNVVTYHEKNRQSAALQVADGEDILIFPWNQYNADTVIPYSMRKDMLAAEQSSEFTGTSKNEIIYNVIANLFPERVPLAPTDFYSALEFDAESGIAYLKDFVYSGEKTGITYVLNLAFTDNALLYVNCIPEQRPASYKSAYKSAEREVEAMLRGIFSPNASPLPAPPGENAEEITEPSPSPEGSPPNALTQFFDSLYAVTYNDFTFTNVPFLDKYIGSEYQQLLLDGQLLLIFPQASVVLFYDPEAKIFCGFSTPG